MSAADDMLVNGLPPLGVEVIRRRLRDYPVYNELVKQELSDEEIAEDILKAVGSFNSLMPFFSGYMVADFPDRGLLEDWAICEAIMRLYLWHARNQFSATDAGLQIPIHEQWQPLLNIEQNIRARVMDRAMKLKGQLNVQRALGGGVHSVLRYEGYGGW